MGKGRSNMKYKKQLSLALAGAVLFGVLAGCHNSVEETPGLSQVEYDPQEAIAPYLEVPCAVMAPNDARFAQVEATIDEWKVDGVVSITLHSCNPFGIETYNIQRVCEQCGVPHLHICTDFSDGDQGQIRTRIEAFLELLQERREAV